MLIPARCAVHDRLFGDPIFIKGGTAGANEQCGQTEDSMALHMIRVASVSECRRPLWRRVFSSSLDAPTYTDRHEDNGRVSPIGSTIDGQSREPAGLAAEHTRLNGTRAQAVATTRCTDSDTYLLLVPVQFGAHSSE